MFYSINIDIENKYRLSQSFIYYCLLFTRCVHIQKQIKYDSIDHKKHVSDGISRIIG